MAGKGPVTVAEYDRAVEVWPTELLGRVRNAMVVPTWFAGEERFWYRLETPAGHEFVVVDAVTGVSEAAFDHAWVAGVLGADADVLPIASFVWEGDALVATLDDGTVRRIEPDGTASEVPGEPNELADIVKKGFLGPDGQEAFVHEHNLWIRDAQGNERPLTTDGEPLWAWATGLDAFGVEGITRAHLDLQQVSEGVFWSPDGSSLLVHRIDERDVSAYPYMESIRLDGGIVPRVHEYRFQMIGDESGPRIEWFVIDVASGSRVRVDDLPEDLDIQPWLAWWTPQNTILAIAHNVAQDALGLVEVDAGTGAVRMVHLERDHMLRLNDVWFNEDNIRYLPQRGERGEVIWWSQQDGFGHLYAIDVATGGIRQLTQGGWMVIDLQLVTDEHAFFTAGGTVAGENPYYRKLHRVALDGGPNADLRCLTPEDADHAFPAAFQGTVYRESGPVQQHPLRHCISPSGRFFVDNVSRVDLPTVTLLRDASGTLVTELCRADVSGLKEIGWRAPEVFSVKAADGVTDVWGVLILPREFDEKTPKSLPIMERIYGGHQVLTQPRSFLEGLSGSFVYAMYSLAELGFAVPILDGPGTPWRSREFRDMTWDQPDRFGLAHHRAAIENLAATRPYLDLDRVGVNGHSSGGYTSLMCLLLEPDFYRVAVSSSPSLGADGSGSYVSETHLGRPDYGDGRRVRRDDAELAPNLAKFDPRNYVEHLAGDLLFLYGDIDAQCPPQQLLQMADALVAAGKSFDVVPMPGESHYYTTKPYYQKRVWDYFLEHLQGRKPLRHHVLDVPVGTRLSET